ncbi:hypothetical protein [Pelagibaculum spongiae]|uniref:Uncharacterized protein n=1 Tax=Pelagibaculum spongiae TaxID=2080658 RepID=A0A2V1GYC4_9GAMM|nr:hypothetical protein [Pelagibaculum spongiae]PVZ66763.1 hypothetical protein DC094_15985 [Pelagibaculum spongiae]
MKIILGLSSILALVFLGVALNYRLTLYVPVYASVEGSAFQTAAFIKVRGEPYGKKIETYSGHYKNIISFYRDVLGEIYKGNDVRQFFINGRDDEVANFISVERFGKGKIRSEKLLSIMEHDNKISIFIQRELIGYDIKPLMFFSVIDEGQGRYKILPKNQLGVVSRALLGVAFRARESKEDVSFLGLYDKLLIEIGCVFSCQKYQKNDYSVVVTKKDPLVNGEIVDLIEQGDAKLSSLIEKLYFSTASVESLERWVKNSELTLEEIAVSSLYGSGLKFSKIVPLNDECQIYVFSKIESSMNVFVCNDLISNVFYSSENNDFFNGI